MKKNDIVKKGSVGFFGEAIHKCFIFKNLTQFFNKCFMEFSSPKEEILLTSKH